MALMHRRASVRFFLLLLAAGAANALSAETTATTGDQLSISISETGALTGLSVGGERLLPDDLAEFHPVSVCDVTRGPQFVPVEAKAGAGDGGKTVVREAALDALSLRLAARYESTGELIRVKLTVGDTSGGDRGLLVRFALPIHADRWQWWDDMETVRQIGTSGTYERSQGMREFAALPEWRDKPALNMGSHSVNFCSVITGPVGLCYAVPLDQPRIFRTGYDADKRLFYIVYDVALARETAPSSTAELTFYLYRCDPDWGMRSALDRYYRLFPHFFAKHVRKEGMWMAFSGLSGVDHANELRFAFQEGAPEPGYDDRLGVDSLTYFTHAGMFANIPDYSPETDPEPSYERQLAAMREHFRRQTGSAEIFDASGLHDADGKLSIKRTAVYGHIIAQYNLDPELPYGKHMLGRIPGVFQSYRERRGGELDGFYYDGITTGINYRREHFPHAGYPPIWDPVAKKPFLYNYFSSVEFARETAERLHAEGKITMMNGAMGSSFYTAPYLDVMGAETGLRIDRSSFNYVRSICRQKPFVTLLKGNFSELTEDDFALFIKRCVAYGVFPGFFDWPPSGLGPGSRYWDHAEWYERDRPNHRKYQALCQQIARAGWEPLTLARSGDPSLALERFGTPEQGEVFFTVLNDRPEAVDTVISIPAAAVPNEPVVVDEVALRWLAESRVEGDRWQVPLHVGPESLAVLHVASKEKLAKSHAQEILENLALRRQMREIDRDRPESLVHWPAVGNDAYERADVDTRSCLKLANESPSQVKGATQWVMLYQDEPEPLKLRLRLKCDGVEPSDQGGLSVRAVLCHVNMRTRFTERKRTAYDVDPGTYDWREKEILITPERSLRSIQLSLELRKCPGTVWIDEISVTPSSDPDRQYVVDPGMDQWYEHPTDAQLQEIDSRFAKLEAEVGKLGDARGDALRDASLSLLKGAYAHRKWIEDNKLQNPCRRGLRELDDAAARLALVGSVLMGVRGPRLEVSPVAVHGEELPVRVRCEGVAKSQVRYAVRPPAGWACRSQGDGAFRVAVPQDALGTTGQLVGMATVASPTGASLLLKATAEVRVVPAIIAAMRLDDVSPSGDQFQLAIDVANNAATPTDVSLRTLLPQGWTAQPSLDRGTLDAKSTKTIRLAVIPGRQTKPGTYEIHAELASSKLSVPLDFSEAVSYLPGSLNRLKNPGFEEEDAHWAKNEGSLEIDASQAHGGRRSLKLHNNSPTERSGASQTITLNQDAPRPIVVRGHARAESVSGHQGRGFCIYVDIYYTDGTPLYGQTIDWQTGTTGSQHGQLTIEPATPIRNVNVYLLLRGHSGTAWFDDVFVAESPRP